MKIKAIVPYYGSKRNLASEIIEAIGDHVCYWEPFCGSMSVLLAKEPSTMETVNDAYGHLINLALVLQDPELSLQLYANVSRVLMHEGIFFAEAVKVKTDLPEGSPPSVEHATAFFVASWLGRNGMTGSKDYGFSYSARFTRAGGHAATRWMSATESIPDWHQRLRHVTILRRDAFEIIDRIGDEYGTVIFCDPPYVDKSSRYLYDFPEDGHFQLSQKLARFKNARVVLTYYDHPLVRELYRGWVFREVEVLVAMSNSRKKSRFETELIICNQGIQGALPF